MAICNLQAAYGYYVDKTLYDEAADLFSAMPAWRSPVEVCLWARAACANTCMPCRSCSSAACSITCNCSRSSTIAARWPVGAAAAGAISSRSAAGSRGALG